MCSCVCVCVFVFVFVVCVLYVAEKTGEAGAHE